MNSSTDIDPILTLDEELARLNHIKNRQLTKALTLKEILGLIFKFAVTAESRDPNFPGIQKGARNLLLVCHCWYEVARDSPELWTSWGNSLEDWKRWHNHSGTSMLDLVLDGLKHKSRPFDAALSNPLMEHSARDAVRKVHLRDQNKDTVLSILLLLALGGGSTGGSIESIVLEGIDPSVFFKHRRFPKLRKLSLAGYPISALTFLESPAALVDLSLSNHQTSFAPISISPIISLLASSPDMRTLKLKSLVFDDDSSRSSGDQVSLLHLEKLSLTGNRNGIFKILRQLKLPGTVRQVKLVFSGCIMEDTTAIVKSICGYLILDSTFGNKLRISFSADLRYISVSISDAGAGSCDTTQTRLPDLPQVRFSIDLVQDATPGEKRQTWIDILRLLPTERIAYFETNFPEVEEAMPELQVLHLFDVELSSGFLLPKHNRQNAHNELLPSLRTLYLDSVTAEDDNWDPLVNYLTHRQGSRLVLLTLSGAHICSETLERIKLLVQELRYLPDSDYLCPVRGCMNGV